MSRKSIERVAKMMNETGLMEITSEFSAAWGLMKRKIHLSKQEFCAAGAATGSGNDDSPAKKRPLGTEIARTGEGTITSPMVGVVYLAPDRAAKPFVAMGQRVLAGETLCLVEAMKTFNPIKSPKDGIVSEILVGEGETVEFGAPLMVVK